MTTVSLGYEPRGAFIPFHMRSQRWACLVCHRRAGKTVACVADLIDAALRSKKPNPRFAYVAPYFAQAKDVAWVYLKQFGLRIPGASVNETELRLDLPNGARVRLYGADNYDRLRGLFLDGIVLDEYADMDPRAWPEVIRPALSDRQGWGVFIGTPKGRNDFYRMYEYAEASEDWFAMTLKADDSGLIALKELEDAKSMMTPEQYAQEYLCSFDAAIQGAYYASLLADAEAQGRVRDFDADPALPIYTAWDLGIGDSTAIWVFQAAPDGMRLIDHIEDHGKPLPHYVAELNARGYKVRADYVPHDARVRELGTGRTRLETLAGMGRNPQLLPVHQVDDGINAVRQLFPRMWIARRCKDGIEALRQYRTDFDEKAKVFKKTPRHDWTSHTADALRYAAMGYRDLVLTRIAEKAKPAPGQVWIGPPATSGEKRSRI
jgi:phage terminase large subunit